MTERETKHVQVTQMDLWALQKAIKFNTFMLDPRNMQPIFPMTLRRYPNGEVVQVHTAWKLREKINRLLMRMLDEKLAALNMPLDYDECWYIDNVLSADAYQGDGMKDAFGQGGARRLLTQVFRVIYEYEQGVALRDGGEGDTPFSFDALAEYIRQSGDDGGWKRPGSGPEDPGAGSRS